MYQRIELVAIFLNLQYVNNVSKDSQSLLQYFLNNATELRKEKGCKCHEQNRSRYNFVVFISKSRCMLNCDNYVSVCKPVHLAVTSLIKLTDNVEMNAHGMLCFYVQVVIYYWYVEMS